MRRLLALLAVLSLLLVACGDDDGDGSDEETTEEPADAGPEALDVTVTADGLEGLPDEVPSGSAEVSLTIEEGDAEELNLTRVEDGADTGTFAEDITATVSGGPFPDYMLGNVGALDGSTVALPEGDYIAWIDKAALADRESTPDDISSQELTVTSGDEAELPEAEGAITAADYAFDVDVAAGPGTVNFANDGPDQFHHAIVVDFGTNDPAAVEENFTAILEAESPADAPEGIDAEQVDFEFAFSPVNGPGDASTFEADFVSGNTYGVVCFIQDRMGGPPHAFAYDMYEVFTVD